MADIELIIKIPEDVFKRTVFYREFRDLNDCVTTIKALENGTPLPKGHGRLIDAKAYEQDVRKHYFDDSTVIRCAEITLSNAPTIIEADKGEQE